MTVVNHDARNQYTATGGQTTFSYTFEIAAASDIAVYQRASTADPDDAADLLTYLTDYTLTGVGNNNGGTVVLVSGAALNDIITIQSIVPAERDSSFTPGGVIQAENLNTEFDNLVLIYQRLLALLNDLTPRYANSAYVQSRDLILPVLGDNQIWQMDTGSGEIQAVDYDPNETAAALAAALASHDPGEGASLVGLQDQFYVSSKTVQDLANASFILESDSNAVQNAFVLQAGSGVSFTPGTRTLTISATGLGGTVTSFSSGDLSPLFTTSVATATTTPALSFILTNAGANTYFGNATGGAAAPSYTAAGALTKVDDTNVTLTLGGSPTVSLLAAVSLTLGWTGQLGLTRGGTAASLTAVNGGIVYSTAAALAISAAGSNGQLFQSAGAATPVWTTATYPSVATSAGTILRADGTNWLASTSTFADTYAISTLLYASSANTVQELATANSAMLRTNSTGVPAWSASMTDGQLMIGATGGTPLPATLTAGPGISIANAANAVTISGTGSGIGWTEVTAATQAMSADSGYVSNRATLVTFTLPLTAAFGTVISLIGKGAGGWQVNQNAGQNIQIGSSSSTVGVGGSIASSNQFDSIDLICTTADTTWTAQGGVQGAITIV